MELEEVSEGTLIFETKIESNFTHRHGRRFEQVTSFMVDAAGELIIDGVARDFLYHTTEIGGRDAELVGIELYLPLFSKIDFSQVEKYFIDIFLVSEVWGQNIIFER